MDFSTLTEFPPISHVMSPSDATARAHTAAQGTVVTEAQLANQIRALVAGEVATSDFRATRRRRNEEVAANVFRTGPKSVTADRRT